MEFTLLVLAAGMGSRYGGLKQIDPVGPSGETLLDYNIFDARRAGFSRVVFVIRHSIEADFKALIGPRYEGKIIVDYAFQELDLLPAGYKVPAGREKPWGTSHAVLAAKDTIRSPFAIVNADDCYGRDALAQAAAHLGKLATQGAVPEYGLVGYPMRNTLSENGTVSRGVCQADPAGFLTSVVEETKIEKDGNGGKVARPDGSTAKFTGDEPVSMNLWTFTPDVFPKIENGFKSFLDRSVGELKAEYYIPTLADELIQSDQAKFRVLTTSSTWLGVTYREDKPLVQAGIRKLIDAGVYPERLD
ncbi:MAG: NTP transferase domain-containing protein [Candidatus Methylacidiphilales bacterium]|nr:NTP transferase domain-containing protein [Candidatus Methylacidiphilales bacterium]